MGVVVSEIINNVLEIIPAIILTTVPKISSSNSAPQGNTNGLF